MYQRQPSAHLLRVAPRPLQQCAAAAGRLEHRLRLGRRLLRRLQLQTQWFGGRESGRDIGR